MGHGQEHRTRDDAQVEIQEKGEIFFFYKPKVNKEEVHSVDDVQRLYIVLRPESGERAVEEKQDPHSGKEGAKSESDEEQPHRNEGGQGSQKVNMEEEPLLRFIVMGRKKLPDPSKKSQSFWGFVELVTTKIEDVKNALKGEEYDTSSIGHRHVPPARAVGEGVYRILRHNPNNKMHTHLIYKLEFPQPKEEEEENEPQESLNIEREGSFLIQINNPSKATNSEFRGVRKKRKAVFPAHLQGQLGKNKYHPADPPDLLNYEGCELLLISASDDIDEELGLELETEGEADPSCSDLVRTFGDTASTTPLFKGIWA
ncbi:putative beta-1,3-galactosyltransferase 19-like [Hibiscus syriacus]|uniref:Beta-1,3-galactosyltransferase 19-like n=1 Tax=Hibiscus syriacus TaxID=106335 RepID=A0A6A3CBE5_HIBSY|nr:uncharacterized protein LOC120204240 [Hibiscus syriacus]KAE8724439.1 putative beta-1,3-galactosyltransferase 19-like [Hibiscus syriacus]